MRRKSKQSTIKRNAQCSLPITKACNGIGKCLQKDVHQAIA